MVENRIDINSGYWTCRHCGHYALYSHGFHFEHDQTCPVSIAQWLRHSDEKPADSGRIQRLRVPQPENVDLAERADSRSRPYPWLE